MTFLDPGKGEVFVFGGFDRTLSLARKRHSRQTFTPPLP